MHDEIIINTTVRLPNGETVAVRKVIPLHEWEDATSWGQEMLMRETAKGLYLVHRMHEEHMTKETKETKKVGAA